MNFLASLGRVAGGWLGLPTREQLGLPTDLAASASLRAGEVPAPVTLVTAAPSTSMTPTAGTGRIPTFRKAPVDAEGFTLFQRKTQHEARLKTEFGFHEKLEAAGMKNMTARRKVLADFDRYVAARPVGTQAAPTAKAKAMPDTTDDDGVPVPADPENDPALPDIIQQLQDVLDALKQRLVPTSDETDDEAKALSALRAGKKLTACQGLMAVTKKLCARGLARESLKGTAKAAAFFNEDDVTVAALNRALRVKPSLGMKTAPVVSKASLTEPLARYRELEVEVRQNDVDVRKYGITAARTAKHAALRREQAALRSKIHAK